MKDCKHQNIVITYKSEYFVPQGFERLWESKDMDLGKYFLRETTAEIVCRDCGKVLKRGNDLNL